MAARRPYGAGSLYTRTDRAGLENWYGHWRANGRQIKRRIGPKRTDGRRDGMTRVQAETQLRVLMAEVTADDVSASSSRRRAGALSITELWEVFEIDARRRGLKESTLDDYGSAVRQHLEPWARATTIDRISRRDVARLVEVLESRGLKAKSIHNYVRILSTLLALAERREWIAANPTRDVELPALQRDDGTVEEPLRFLEVFEVNDLANHAQPGVYEALDRALYLTAALTGLRQGELRGLRWAQVDFAASRVRVIEGHVRGRRTTPKSHKPRSVPMALKVAQALDGLREVSRWAGETDHVFADPATGAPLARTPLMRRYRLALKAAGLDVAFRFHDLRHTFGTSMARAGEPVTTIQAWMGHADLKTTQRYMHYAPAADDAARIDAAFAGADPRGSSPGSDVTSPRDIAAA